MNSSLVKKLILSKGAKSKLWIALSALCIGTTLLLLSVMLWWNFSELLHGKRDNDSLGSTFLTIAKKVTDENMGNSSANSFNTEEIKNIASAPEVEDVGILTANRFPVYAVFSSSIGFETELFLESVEDKFIDKKPEDWRWQPGDIRLPVIISSDFLNLYNYGFALSQGLPQLSESSIKSVAFELRVGRGLQAVTYQAQIAGFSDRISSVLVPESFIKYGNETFAPATTIAPSRLIVRAKDPSSPEFVSFLKEHNYTANNELLRWNKLRSVVEIVSASTGLLALVIMCISLIVIILFIELTVARAQQSISLLLAIGYSPRYLKQFMTKQFLPRALITIVIAFVVTIILQILVSKSASSLGLNLPLIPGWPVFAAALLCMFVVAITVKQAIAKSLRA